MRNVRTVFATDNERNWARRNPDVLMAGVSKMIVQSEAIKINRNPGAGA